jgi:hypothetical protein
LTNSYFINYLISRVEGAAGRRGGKDKRRFHVDARFRIIKHNGEEVDSYSCTGGLVRSFTHTFASGDANTGFGWQLFATCEVCCC